MAGVCGVLDDPAGLPQAPFGEVEARFQEGPCGHVPGRDATGQDTLDGAALVFGEDPKQHAEFLQPP